MQLKTKTKEAWGKTLEKKLKALANQFSEIKAIYQKKTSWGMEVHYVGDFVDREREDAFYREEGEILAWSPEGKLWTHLFNPNNFADPGPFLEPEGSVKIFGRDSYS
ncbi:MAG: hypothetical protein FJ320_08095 [SAR202 cluster bacterium]|nr:hypothetical protein [SAR202 cluster bacterium]